MQLNHLKRIKKWKRSVAVGRGGKRGKTSGRGTKGQNARAGRKLRPEIRDVIMRLPKLRGRGTNTFVSRFSKPVAVRLDVLSKLFSAGESVSIQSLVEKEVIGKKVDRVKIVGGGVIDKPLHLVGVLVTASVKNMIEKFGGSIK